MLTTAPQDYNNNTIGKELQYSIAVSERLGLDALTHSSDGQAPSNPKPFSNR
jgi:hypothetical protein